MFAAEQARGQYRVAFLFSTKSDSRFILPLSGWERLQTRYFGFHRDLTPEIAARLLGARIVYQQRARGQWVAVLEIESAQNVYRSIQAKPDRVGRTCLRENSVVPTALRGVAPLHPGAEARGYSHSPFTGLFGTSCSTAARKIEFSHTGTFRARLVRS
jgi:hypothetical protein